MYRSALLFLIILFVYLALYKNVRKNDLSSEPPPNDWFVAQRIFPQGKINYEFYHTAIAEALQKKQAYKMFSSGPEWQFAGPDNLGGRVSDVEMDPENDQIMYAAGASGGIFKSSDGGFIWTPIFDQQPSLSIGDMAIAPSDANIIYAGTGEPNGGGGSITYDGMGIFKSSDGGNTWNSIGLAETHNTGRIAIDPKNSNKVFVAAMGDLFSNTPDRGIYRTVDGGTTWQQVLYVNDSTGAIDLVINPLSPDTVFAATWERVRKPNRRSYGGISCNIYRSVDGGDNWTLLSNSNGLPSPSNNIGRIGIDIAASDPAIVYAIYADKTGSFAGVYKSVDNGNSWTRTNDATLNNMYSSYGWWFGRIKIDPTNSNIVYTIGLDVYKSSDGGNSWSNISNTIHADNHSLYVFPQNPNLLILGNDGGFYSSANGGSSWTKAEGLPIMQFYTSEIDFQNPTNLYGGAQDNGTNCTTSGNTGDWFSIFGGDGFQCMVDPTNNNFIYAESQYGNLNQSLFGVDNYDRNNWNTPLAMNPLNPKSIYYGSNKLYKSINRSGSWDAISNDLTNGPSSGNLVYGTLTTISVSKADTNVIYVGSDDGNVNVTTNNGISWTNITTGLPQRWITRVAADPVDTGTAYVTLSGYRYDDYLPHIFRTTDYGNTWQDISSNLPSLPVNDIIIDPMDDSTLFIATDGGVYFTQNLGTSWEILGSSLPLVAVTDITLHSPTHTMVAATYGRSMYKIDLGFLYSLEEKTNRMVSVSTFPNPAGEFFNVDFNDDVNHKNAILSLFDMKGERVFTTTLHSRTNRLQIPKFISGIYFYEITENSSTVLKCGKISFSSR